MARLTERSIIEAYSLGNEAIELDTEKLKAIVTNTLKTNLSFCETKVGFYFYDAIKNTSCDIADSKCNSVQMKIEVVYENVKAERIYRYELVSKG